jgi:hypothetical protein
MRQEYYLITLYYNSQLPGEDLFTWENAFFSRELPKNAFAYQTTSTVYGRRGCGCFVLSHFRI